MCRMIWIVYSLWCQMNLFSSVVYQTSVGIANPKQKPTILLCGFESNTLLSKLDCAWDLKGSHTIVCKTFSHTGDHTILYLSPNFSPSDLLLEQTSYSIYWRKEGEKFLEWPIDRDSCNYSSHGNWVSEGVSKCKNGRKENCSLWDLFGYMFCQTCYKT